MMMCFMPFPSFKHSVLYPCLKATNCLPELCWQTLMTFYQFKLHTMFVMKHILTERFNNFYVLLRHILTEFVRENLSIGLKLKVTFGLV